MAYDRMSKSASMLRITLSYKANDLKSFTHFEKRSSSTIECIRKLKIPSLIEFVRVK